MASRKLQQKKDGTYTIVLPKSMVEGLGWNKGEEIVFRFGYEDGSLQLRKK